jgi:hypothetical protein
MGLHRRRVWELAKGFRGRARNCFKIAKQQAEKALQHAYKGRKDKASNMNALWNTRINAAAREHGASIPGAASHVYPKAPRGPQQAECAACSTRVSHHTPSLPSFHSPLLRLLLLLLLHCPLTSAQILTAHQWAAKRECHAESQNAG